MGADGWRGLALVRVSTGVVSGWHGRLHHIAGLAIVSIVYNACSALSGERPRGPPPGAGPSVGGEAGGEGGEGGRGAGVRETARGGGGGSQKGAGEGQGGREEEAAGDKGIGEAKQWFLCTLYEWAAARAAWVQLGTLSPRVSHRICAGS